MFYCTITCSIGKKMQIVPFISLALRCSDVALNVAHARGRCRLTSTSLACIHSLLFSLLIEPVLHSVPVLSKRVGAFQHSLHFPPFFQVAHVDMNCIFSEVGQEAWVRVIGASRNPRIYRSRKCEAFLLSCALTSFSHHLLISLAI